MEFVRTERFKKDYHHLSRDLQSQLPQALARFASNSRHPSLRVKKMEGTRDIWELRLSDNYRVTFQFVREGVILRRVGPHNVLRHP